MFPLVPSGGFGVPALQREVAKSRDFQGLLEPSGGLEPRTPSLPWRFWLAAGGRTTAACRLAFPAPAQFSLSVTPLSRRPLANPENTLTCPQNLSP